MSYFMVFLRIFFFKLWLFLINKETLPTIIKENNHFLYVSEPLKFLWKFVAILKKKEWFIFINALSHFIFISLFILILNISMKNFILHAEANWYQNVDILLNFSCVICLMTNSISVIIYLFILIALSHSLSLSLYIYICYKSVGCH